MFSYRLEHESGVRGRRSCVPTLRPLCGSDAQRGMKCCLQSSKAGSAPRLTPFATDVRVKVKSMDAPPQGAPQMLCTPNALLSTFREQDNRTCLALDSSVGVALPTCGTCALLPCGLKEDKSSLL